MDEQEKPDITTETTDELINCLHYQTSPGIHSFSECSCGIGHVSRGSGSHCSRCIDAELLRRGIDVTHGGTRYDYKRESTGLLIRKQKGESGASS